MATLTDLTNSIKGLHVHSVENVFPDYQGNVDIEIHKHNVGEEWHSYIGQVPVGGIAYLGQLVPKATYGALWAWVQSQDGLLKTEEEWQAIASTQNGNVPFYSTGDGDQHFRMPAIFGYIRGVGANDPAGTYIAEGLPDPTLDFLFREDSTSSGELLELYGTDGYTGTKTSNTSGTDEFMQSALGRGKTTPYAIVTKNKIYGNSEHVTPETCMVLFGVWAFGEVTNIGQVEMSDVVTDFENIRTTALYKTTPHITETWVNGTSWYRVWSDGYIEQGAIGSAIGVDTTITITLPKSFNSTNYAVVCTSIFTGTAAGGGTTYVNPTLKSRTKTKFVLSNDSVANNGTNWYAFGY